MKTYEKLAVALRAVGLEAMAKKADTGYYHDFLSPLDFPSLQLALDLATAAEAEKLEVIRSAILYLRNQIIDGIFDADLAESDEWMSGPEGRDAMRRLVSGQ